MTRQSLFGAVALITDATGGAGASTARALSRRGAAVALVAGPRGRPLIAEEIASQGGVAFVFEADIADEADELVLAAFEHFGRLDILVNNAEIMLLGIALHAPLADWNRMVELNLSAVLRVTHAALPYLIDAAVTSPRHTADIVNITSPGSESPRAQSSAYELTRSGVLGFSESLRQELVGEHVRVSVVQRGTYPDERPGDLPLAVGSEAARSPSAAATIGDEVAEAVAFVVTRDARAAVDAIVIRPVPESDPPDPDEV